METKWYHNSKTGEIDSYDEGELEEILQIFGKAITIDFGSKERAENFAKSFGYCKVCDSTRDARNDIWCPYCNQSEIKFVFKKK